MAGFDDVIDVMTDNPWWVVGALVLGFVILRPKNNVATSPRVDLSATLASQEIAAGTNIALAGFGADVQKARLQRDAVQTSLLANVANIAGGVAIADTNAATRVQVSSLESTNTLVAQLAKINSDLFGIKRGAEIASQSLGNQAIEIGNNKTIQLQLDRNRTNLIENESVRSFNEIDTSEQRFLNNLTPLSNFETALLRERGKIELAIQKSNNSFALAAQALAGTLVAAGSGGGSSGGGGGGGGIFDSIGGIFSQAGGTGGGGGGGLGGLGDIFGTGGDISGGGSSGAGGTFGDLFGGFGGAASGGGGGGGLTSGLGGGGSSSGAGGTFGNLFSGFGGASSGGF